MSKLLRYYSSGQIYFVTSVTYSRHPVLIDNIDLLHGAIDRMQGVVHVNLLAWVVMPDHLHLLIDPKESNLSQYMKRLKLTFSVQYRRRFGLYRAQVWQRRFWDHVIRGQIDWNNHVNYIHYNPVKHGLVKSPFDWTESSIHGYLEEGYYSQDWGTVDTINFEGDYGE